MNKDEHEIRELITTWMSATKDGDTETVLSLMADDVKFLVPGRPPFSKEVFASSARSQGNAAMEIDGRSDILEITVAGEWAFVVTYLTVNIRSKGSADMERAGNTLTIFTKRNGRWLLYRDANLLAPVRPANDGHGQGNELPSR